MRLSATTSTRRERSSRPGAPPRQRRRQRVAPVDDGVAEGGARAHLESIAAEAALHGVAGGEAAAVEVEPQRALQGQL